eukprot:3941872-Rhodomonas_salina.2
MLAPLARSTVSVPLAVYYSKSIGMQRILHAVPSGSFLLWGSPRQSSSFTVQMSQTVVHSMHGMGSVYSQSMVSGIHNHALGPGPSDHARRRICFATIVIRR